MVGKQDGLRVAKRRADDAAFVVGHGNAWPFGKMRRAVQHRAIHMDGLERLAGRRERRGIRRMRVDDRIHVRPLAVDPDVEAHPRIRPPALQRPQIVDQHHALGARLLEAVAELQGPPASRLLAPRRDLAGETRLMPFSRQDPAGRRQRLARGKRRGLQVFGHLAADALEEMGFFMHG